MTQIETKTDAPVSAPAQALSPLGPRKLLLLAGGGAAALLVVAVVCSFIGKADLSQAMEIRWTRLLSGAIVGAALAVAGAALQGLLRNPLAEPYILGVSSGAGVGVLAGVAMAGTVAGANRLDTSLLAVAGAMLTCLAVYAIAQRRGRLDPYVLLLSGVIVNVFNGALMLALLLYVNPNEIDWFVKWSMGRLPESWARVGWTLSFSGPAVLAGWALLLYRGAAFNALSLGDTVAASSGVGVHWLRVETFVVVAVMTSAAVALAGPIGFLGLVVPHICRLIVGPDHRLLMLSSGFAGAIFLIVADTLCRNVGQVIGLGIVPVGVLTALTGGPFFIFLLRRRGRGGRV